MKLSKRILALLLTVCLLLAVAVPMASAASLVLKIQIGTKGEGNYQIIANPGEVGTATGSGYEQFKFNKSDVSAGNWIAVRINDTSIFGAGEYHLSMNFTKISNVEEKGGRAEVYLIADTDKTGAELESYISGNMNDSTLLGTVSSVASEVASYNAGAAAFGESFILVIKSAPNQTPQNGNDCWVRLAAVYLVPVQTCGTADELSAALARITGEGGSGSTGTTIKLTADFAAGDVVIPGNVTLDLNGHTLTVSSYTNNGKEIGEGSVKTVDPADKAAAEAVQGKIDAIGTVTAASEDAIKAARAAYDALTDTQKGMVNIAALTAAETALADLKAEAAAVQAQIDAIGTVTLESEEAIKAARAAYDALSDDLKALVNADALTAAEAKLDKLQNPSSVSPILIAVIAVLAVAAIGGVAFIVIRKKKS